MTLDAWLRYTNTTEKALGEAIGRTQATINRYRHGLRMPSPADMRLIVQVTGGLVTANDFYGL